MKFEVTAVGGWAENEWVSDIGLFLAVGSR